MVSNLKPFKSDDPVVFSELLHLQDGRLGGIYLQLIVPQRARQRGKPTFRLRGTFEAQEIIVHVPISSRPTAKPLA
jgi:hypothetical protein